MKKSCIFFIILCVSILAGCEYHYPPENLKVSKIKALSVGETVEIELLYPNTGGSKVSGWKNQYIEIISGEDIICSDGLSVTALKAGTATLKIKATTTLFDDAISDGFEEREYSTDIIKIKVR